MVKNDRVISAKYSKAESWRDGKMSQAHKPISLKDKPVEDLTKGERILREMRNL